MIDISTEHRSYVKKGKIGLNWKLISKIREKYQEKKCVQEVLGDAQACVDHTMGKSYKNLNWKSPFILKAFLN